MPDGSRASGDTEATILVCDDNAAMRALLTAVLETGLDLCVVGEASDGHEAVAAAERLQPDVILLDLAMPRRNGLEALPDLRRVAPAARIVVFSGFASATVADDVVALGAAAYLEKGSPPEAIVAAVAATLT